MENKLLVFLSSPIAKLLAERRAVGEALAAVPLTRPWAFECTPASADPLEESYLDKVGECDLFILLLGQNITDPVRKEWQTASVTVKPRLVFLKKCHRSLEAQTFVEAIDVKWVEFATTDELRRQVQEAVTDELIKGYRRYRLRPRDLGPLGEFLEWLKGGRPAVGGDNVRIIIGDHARHVAAGKDIAQIVGDCNVIGDGSSSRVVKVDNRSGGVYFEGEGSVHIQGDVIGSDQTKTSHETHFHGSITGPVHTGSGDIHIGSMSVGADASLETLLAALRQAVAAQAPPAVQSKALQRVDSLAETIAEREPDLGLMESALGWFQKHLPSLAGAVVAVIFHPAMAQTIEAAGEPAVAEFQRRFGRLSGQRGFTDEW